MAQDVFENLKPYVSLPSGDGKVCRPPSISHPPNIFALSMPARDSTCLGPQASNTRHETMWDPILQKNPSQAPLEQNVGLYIQKNPSQVSLENNVKPTANSASYKL
ncbi:hypothetical protein ElyMa_003850800 [Elysia marginata]|uniref:Uncharacterized protein n=1 Tax=Elysia marginata TaxID=1093978 RepID=A0AAV4FH78_9GAST|nr:hypothetical protein ElyMa_003850800 [Elysia marginata]